MKVGAIEILPLLDGTLLTRFPTTKPVPDRSSLEWQEQHGAFTDDGMMVSDLGAFLVRTGDRLVLVDAGAGRPPEGGFSAPLVDADDPHDPLASYFRGNGMPDDMVRRMADNLAVIQLTQGQLPASLDALGVRPDDVTDIVFTHLHFDHIGWASAEGAAYFPNATLHCAAADLDYFLPGPPEDWFVQQVFKAPAVPDRLGPVVDRIETWESDSTVLPGIDVRLAPGHTPGSSVVVVSSGTARAMLLGDVVHCPLELQDDDFNLLGDHDQALADRARQAYARELEGSSIPVAAAHFPGLRFGRLLPGEGVRHWTFDAG